ncbi:hypothetical protein [Streptomyces sp. NPDC059883]|uniref:hypothetical protein n=1 Tax=unclassified Streptomyces TaxID=2593676 RepID=UPI003663FCA1
MHDTDGLARYRAKRHFDRTDEPPGEPGRAAPGPRRARSARTGRTPRQVVRADVPGWGAR